MTITLGILGFHNCDGCSQKVRTALRTIGIEMVKLDRETGNVTVSNSQNPEVIRSALQRQLKKSVAVLSRDLVPANRPTNATVSRHVPANQTLDLQGLGQEVLRLAQNLDGVEITTSRTTRIDFIHRESSRVVRSEPRGNVDRETQVVIRPRPEHQGNTSVHPHRHRHSGHHGESEKRGTGVEPRGSSGEHPKRSHHDRDRHHGQPQSRRHH